MKGQIWGWFALLCALVAGPALARGNAVEICAGTLMHLEGRTLLIRLMGVASSTPDRMRLTLPSSDLAAAARLDPRSGWTMQRKGSKLLLEAVEPSHDAEIRIVLPAAPAPPSLEIRVFSGRKKLARLPLAVARPLPRLSQEFFRLPAMMTPGETIGLRKLHEDECWAPPGGRWRIAGVEAIPSPRDPSFLNVQLPDDLDPRLPVSVRYALSDGTVTVDGNFHILKDVFRIVPPLAVPPSAGAAPRLADCDGTGASLTAAVCVCGWFPAAPLGATLQVDGQPQAPIAVSQRSMCFNVDLGEHLFVLPGKDSPDATSTLRQSRLAVKHRPRSIAPGRTQEVTWQVSGSKRPVELSIVNQSPEIVRFRGGPFQHLRTSGGRNNRAGVDASGLRPGAARISLRLQPPRDEAPGEIRSLFRHYGHQTFEEAEQSFFRQAEAGDATSDASELVELVRQTRDQLLQDLRYPDLAALYDYTKAYFDDLLDDVQAERQATAREADRPPHLAVSSETLFAASIGLPAGGQSPPTVRWASSEEDSAVDDGRQQVIARVLAFFDNLLADEIELARDLQIRSTRKRDKIYFRLFPRSFPDDQRGGAFTDLRIDNLFLGKYTWEASLGKNQGRSARSSGELNLLRGEADILCCTYREEGPDLELVLGGQSTRAAHGPITCKWIAEADDECP